MTRRDATQGLFTGVGLGYRLQALVIDGTVTAVLLMLCFVLVWGWPATIEIGALAETRPTLSAMTWLDWIFALTFPHGLILGCWLMLGTSPGKRYIGAFLVDNRTGQRPRTWQLVVRYLCAFAPYLAALLSSQEEFLLSYSAYALLLVSPRRRAWHDFCAGTVVVRPLGSGSTVLSFERRGPRIG